MAPDVVDRYLAVAPDFTQGLQGHVQADLAAVLEAVCQGLGYPVDSDSAANGLVFFDTLGKRRT